MKKKAIIAILLALFAAGLTLNAGPGNGSCQFTYDDYLYYCSGGAGYCGMGTILCNGVLVKVMPLHPDNPWGD